MTFCEAIPILAGGDRISRHEEWEWFRLSIKALGRNVSFVWLGDARGEPAYERQWSPGIDDLTASDWYVLPLREWTEETNARQ